MPGGIDAHVHFDFGLGHLRSQPYDQGSRAALHGGTTTIVDFAFRPPEGGSLLDALAAKRADAERDIRCDFALHLIVTGAVGDAELAEIEGVVAAGVPTVKVFMNFPDFYPGDGATAELFAALGRAGGHGGRARRERRRDRDAHAAADRRRQARLAPHRGQPPGLGRGRGGRASDPARRGGRLPALRPARDLRGGGSRDRGGAGARACAVFAETCHNYAVFSKRDVVERPDGANWGNYPPLRPPANRDALWEALADGVLCHVSSDDSRAPRDAQRRRPRPAGAARRATTASRRGMAVLFTEAVVTPRHGAQRFAALAGGEAARALGLWPRKGSLLPGADGDLVVIDPQRSGRWRLDDLHTVDHSIWEGYEYRGAPVATIYAGRLVVADGVFVGPDVRGRFLPRHAGPPSA